MINAVFYSDQIIPVNEKVGILLTKPMSERGRRIGYFPSGPDPGLRFFSEKRAHYGQRGLPSKSSTIWTAITAARS
ncbi:hypothetical protein [Mesorhizobium sp.]|nr:hypothetical protein [Mesorhizobium sp.]TIL48207.1 MAG: hypothetical protein E5Y83_32275 [Mesorhizobium sp.]TIR26961.1 MAG: hypothetical protein E5X35_34535 [Mesorhizobium sp.]